MKLKTIEIKCTGTAFLSLEDLTKFQGNLKKLTNENRNRLKNSILKRGFIAPFFIYENDGVYNLLDGTQRKATLEHMQSEGYEIPELPVVFIKADSEADAREKLLAITSSFGEFDIEELSAWIEDFDDDIADSFRFVDGEIDFNFDVEHEETEGDDDISEDIENGITKLGDLWELGNHRVLCGDSTDSEQVNILMDGKKADMVFTDPPYGVDYEGIKNDDRQGLSDLLNSVFSNYKDNSKSGASIYCFHSDRCADIFHIEFRKFFHFSSMIIWNKNSLTMSQTDYQSKHEPCMYGWMNNGTHSWHSDRKQVSVWDVDKQQVDGHTTPKPIKIIENAINNSSKSEDITIDYFLGSGSTLIACEKTNRICYGLELDCYYVDVIVKRYIDWCTKNNHEITVKLNGEDFDYSVFDKPEES